MRRGWMRERESYRESILDNTEYTSSSRITSLAGTVWTSLLSQPFSLIHSYCNLKQHFGIRPTSLPGNNGNRQHCSGLFPKNFVCYPCQYFTAGVSHAYLSAAA